MEHFATTLYSENEQSDVEIPLEEVLEFLTNKTQSVALLGGAPMEPRYAGDVIQGALDYYAANYPDELKAGLKEYGIELKFK
jgi:hypothetical protein